MIHKCYALCAVLIFAATTAPAADFSDPTWPCVQRKVERLSIGLMWPEALPESPPEDAKAEAVEELAETLALRRVDLEEARDRVRAFAESHGHDTDLMGAVFAEVFDTLASRRTRIIDGIGDFSLGQIALSEKIDAGRVEMDAQMAKDDPDFGRVDALEEQVDWDQRIFSDRQQTITYLCETPTLLEKRLYAISQMLQEAGQGGG